MRFCFFKEHTKFSQGWGREEIKFIKNAKKQNNFEKTLYK